MKTRSEITNVLLAVATAVIGMTALAGCSSTSNLPEGEVLYTGLKPAVYTDRDSADFSSK